MIGKYELILLMDEKITKVEEGVAEEVAEWVVEVVEVGPFGTCMFLRLMKLPVDVFDFLIFFKGCCQAFAFPFANEIWVAVYLSHLQNFLEKSYILT